MLFLQLIQEKTYEKYVCLMFDEDMIAMDCGVSIDSITFAYKIFAGSALFTKHISEIDKESYFKCIDKNDKEIIDSVLNETISLSNTEINNIIFLNARYKKYKYTYDKKILFKPDKEFL